MKRHVVSANRRTWMALRRKKLKRDRGEAAAGLFELRWELRALEGRGGTRQNLQPNGEIKTVKAKIEELERRYRRCDDEIGELGHALKYARGHTAAEAA